MCIVFQVMFLRIIFTRALGSWSEKCYIHRNDYPQQKVNLHGTHHLVRTVNICTVLHREARVFRVYYSDNPPDNTVKNTKGSGKHSVLPCFQSYMHLSAQWSFTFSRCYCVMLKKQSQVFQSLGRDRFIEA
jgi:hypothetical protein